MSLYVEGPTSLTDAYGLRADPTLYNADLAPTTPEQRTWGTYNYIALWFSMSMEVTTYMLASSLIAGGMNWKQAIATILMGNLIVLVPMILNAHAGAKYGIPFPVLVRASFGVRGAQVPAMLRALVACGWFGIQSWIGGQAIHTMLQVLWPQVSSNAWMPWICFYLFWLLTMAVIWRGIDTIKYLEGIGAPFMLAVGVLLLWWIARKAGGLGPVLHSPSKFKTTAEFMRFFIPSLTGMVGFWAPGALKIPDFTRYARSQKAQMIGQALGLPASMTIYSFIGVAVTSASVILFGQAIWDPVALLARFHEPVIASIALVALLVAPLNTNVAANVVSPSNDFSNLNPRLISFRTGGLITGVVGVLMMPWRLLTDYGSYIFGWLVGYSGLLGPVAGIMITDSFLLRRTHLDVGELYNPLGIYRYGNGVNYRALVALAAGIVVALIGLLVPPLRWLYDYAWFVGFFVAAVTYWVAMRTEQSRGVVATEPPVTSRP